MVCAATVLSVYLSVTPLICVIKLCQQFYVITPGSFFPNTTAKFRGNHPRRCLHAFSFCDLDFEPMTLMYKLDLHILKMCLHAENEVSRSCFFFNFRAQTGHTDRHDRTYYHTAFATKTALMPTGWLLYATLFITRGTAMNPAVALMNRSQSYRRFIRSLLEYASMPVSAADLQMPMGLRQTSAVMPV